MRLLIQYIGENNVGVFLLTLPDGLSIKEFQKKWHNFQTGVLRKIFPVGMWTRERQPRSGFWHCHAIVDMGRDIRTGFPFAEVERKDYRNVDRRLRVLWRLLRGKAKAYGFGWNTLEPIKTTGPAAAKYLAKYLSKAQQSEFRVGEERARLFGVWGRKRFVFHRFSWASRRLWRKRLSWYAEDFGIGDVTATGRLIERDDWETVVPALMKVILPETAYQSWDAIAGCYRWDERGWRAYCEDLNHYSRVRSEERKVRLSRFRFYVAVGVSWGMKCSRARRFAARKIEAAGLGNQRHLGLTE